ncbi:MAG: hypothetical protein ACOYMG_29935, partial [Candidatus Methylumidiphilus sp.]
RWGFSVGFLVHISIRNSAYKKGPIGNVLQPVPRASSYRLRMPVSSAMPVLSEAEGDGNMPLAQVLDSGTL